jgi:hypothetical protein
MDSMPDDPVTRLNAAFEGHYRVERKLGEGGMASVYLAEDLKHHRLVAIKAFEAKAGLPAAAERFEREIETIAGLRHPHILPLHDSGQTEGLMYFVMPFVEGGTLRDRLNREGPLPLVVALRIAKEVAQALAYAHGRGIVHRDVKPANIMLDSGHAVVSDFGVALLTAGSSADRLTATGASPGTPVYMSPEQLDDDRPVDSRSDLYSLGCVLYEMLAGEPPFTGSSTRVIVSRKLVDPVPPLRTLRDNVPEAVERLTLQALERAPADRPRSAAELAERLVVLESEVGAQDITTGGLRLDSGLIRSPLQLASLVATMMVGAVALLATVGMLATRVFDRKVQMPLMYAPSRGDYLAVGAQALIPLVIWGFLGLGVWLLIVRYLLPWTEGGISRLTHAALGKRMTARGSTRKRAARPLSGASLADLFLVAMVAFSIAVIALPPFGEVYYALLDVGTEALGCAERPLHRLHALGLPAMIVGFGLARHTLFRRIRSRLAPRAGWALARWASAVWLVVLVVVAALPWRVLWDAEYPRALIGTERAYVIVEDEQRVLAYTPSTRSVQPYDTDEVDITRLGLVGYLFEEAEVFESSLPGCSLMTLGPTS